MWSPWLPGVTQWRQGTWWQALRSWGLFWETGLWAVALEWKQSRGWCHHPVGKRLDQGVGGTRLQERSEMLLTDG